MQTRITAEKPPTFFAAVGPSHEVHFSTVGRRRLLNCYPWSRKTTKTFFCGSWPIARGVFEHCRKKAVSKLLSVEPKNRQHFLRHFAHRMSV
jgi:hypothetical protein